MASCWLMLLTLASWFYRPELERNAFPLRLLVIIPAHNEEQQIQATINNVRKCDYPQELVDIAESALRRNVINGDNSAIFYTLNNAPEAKRRGWGPRQEVTGVDGEPVKIVVEYVNADD